jgi:hypothetical protein
MPRSCLDLGVAVGATALMLEGFLPMLAVIAIAGIIRAALSRRIPQRS